MTDDSHTRKPPGFELCVAIFLAVCFTVGMFNWLTAPRDPVTLQKAEVSTAEPWTATAAPTAVPTPTLRPSAAPAATEAPASDDGPAPSAAPDEPVTGSWVLNSSSKRFHLPGCSSVPTIKEKNRVDFTGSRETLIERGYKPCGVCKP